MDRFDAIVIGGGMAGLSSAAFLGLAGRSVALVEKQDKPGGLASSFSLRGLRFDLGIEGLRELAPDSYLCPFLRWWDVDLPMEARDERMAVHTARGSYGIRGSQAREELRRLFPALSRRVDRFFDINEKIVAELSGGGAPKPPYEMSLAEKLSYALSSLAKRPTLLRHGLRDASRVLPELLGDPELIRIASSKTFEDMVYLSVAYRWEALGSGKIMYPKGGIGALPEAIAASIRARGGELRLGAEAMAARPVAGGFEVECSDGRSLAAPRLIVAAPMPWAAFRLFRGDPRFDSLRAAVGKRRLFPSCFMSFVALAPSFDLKGANYIVDWADEGRLPSLWSTRSARGELGPEEAPIACIVGAGSRDGSAVAMTVMSTLGWNYASRWSTRAGSADGEGAECAYAPDGYRGSEAYRRAKLDTERIILDRLEARLGPGFKEAILFSSSSTPLSFARYTNNPGGSFMGFSIRAGEYGRFFEQRGPLPGLFFAGQWVFPGFGVAGAAASGYYAVRSLLSDQGTDLDALLRAAG